MSKEIDHARAFAGEMARAWGPALDSVVLYGSAARGEYRPGQSDLNLLVLLADTSADTLRRGTGLARGWVQEKNPPPLVLSRGEFLDSADVFPIELADMRDAHVLLHGADPFTGLEIRPEDLRLQLERELKAAQIRLRERWLLHSGDAKALEPVVLKSLSTFLVLFRTVLRLGGAAGVHAPAEVIAQTAARVGFDPAPLQEIERARSAQGAPALGAGVVEGYLHAVARVVEYVDRFGAAGEQNANPVPGSEPV